MISDFVTLVRGHALSSAVLSFVERPANEYSGYGRENPSGVDIGDMQNVALGRILHLRAYVVAVE